MVDPQPAFVRRFRRRSATDAIGIKESSRQKWLRKQLLRKHAGLCHLCGCQCVLSDESSPRYATVDHIVPLSQGGRDSIDNCALACRECNERKGNTTEVTR